MKRGRFITLEGGEGAGKSTQVRALAAALRAHGLEVIETREPGGSAGAEAIRELLLGGADDRWNPRSEALLFAAARSDHVARIIQPALERGAWVISDRYIDSNRAYQGGSGQITDAEILTLHRIGSGGLMPDRTFLLQVPAAIAAARVRTRDGDVTDRIGGRNSAFHAAVAGMFEKISAEETDRVRRIDCSGSAQNVTEALLSALSDLRA